MLKINYQITAQNVVVNYDGQTHIINRQDQQEFADQVISAIREKRNDEIPKLVSINEKIRDFSNGNFVVENGCVLVEGKPVSTFLSNKIIEFAKQNLPYEPLLKFAKKVQANPSYRAVNDLYLFLEKNNHPLTETGNFIAYKKVGSDFMDLRSHTFNNSPGQTVLMPRNEVDEDPNVTCSKGLHVANWDYAYNHYGSSNDIMLEVEVDPADVVAIPVDYSQAKMRVCKYFVLQVVDKENSSKTLIQKKQENLTEFEESKDELNEEEEDDLDEEDLDTAYSMY